MASSAQAPAEVGANDARSLPPSDERLPDGLRCPVDGVRVTDARRGVLWQGRRYYVDADACRDAFLRTPDAFASATEPRGALFSASTADMAGSTGLLVFALAIVTGLVTGGIAAFLATRRAVPAWRWFLLGLVGNLVGLAIAYVRLGARPRVDTGGLAKIASTATPVACSTCGRTNHPLAQRCGRCGAALQPAATSEAALASAGRAS